MEDSFLIVFYITGHGLGHATREIEIAKHLTQAGHSVVAVSGAPAAFFKREIKAPSFSFRKAVLDSGSKQSDAFSVDMKASLDVYWQTAVANRESMLETEVGWLRAARADLVVSDTVPLACAAAKLAGVPCACISNFSWDFVFSEYCSRTSSKWCNMVWQVAEDLSQADVVLRLPGYSPMPAFKDVVDVPLVVRHARRSREEVRQELQLPDPAIKLALFMFGAQPPGNWCLTEETLPPGWVCVICSGGRPLTAQPLPPNFQLAAGDAYTPDLVNACDCVVGKIGYGTMSEVLAHNKPFVFIRRDFFNEEPFLRKLLELHGFALEMNRKDFLALNWAPFLEKAATMKPHYRDPTNGAAVATRLLLQIAKDKGYMAPTEASASTGTGPDRSLSRAGSVRLRDAVVWGYMMQRNARRGQVEVPEWYTRGLAIPEEVQGESPTSAEARQATLKTVLDTFDVLKGAASLERCPDTIRFLQTLAALGSHGPSAEEAAAELPEMQAARGLFQWQLQTDVIVARAPGRLDVMGGIADYSGSLVLQLPTAEACHVACQLHTGGSEHLWSHVRARQAQKGQRPALQVVSFHADDTNRGPTFDMELSDLLQPDGNPISYKAARAYFQQDPAHSWAAYVAGALVVLMHERGLRIQLGMSLLIDSAVPEGKGVSSSAAVEVAVMTALVAALQLDIGGRDLALLCQKVENNVVGAPCGVMDQMAAVLGEEGALMAMICQPAEVEPAVVIPAHLRLWGLDSGIRHSVGGNDYGSVRTGAFMGLRMLSEEARRLQRLGSEPPRLHPRQLSSIAESPTPLGRGYLTNILPGSFAQFHEGKLPEAMLGSDFLHSYGSHYDTATEVLPEVTYAVRLPTAHPIHENFRVHLFQQMLQGPLDDPDCVANLGELMYQSHASYSRCGLGSEGTDRLVALVRAEQAAALAAGQQPALFGAKITGGGSGGTVCILGEAGPEAEAAVQRIVTRYRDSTGHSPHEFRGSSAGAGRFGYLLLRRRQAL